VGPEELLVTDGSDQVVELLRCNVEENLKRGVLRGLASSREEGEEEEQEEQEEREGVPVQVLRLEWSRDKQNLKAMRDLNGRALWRRFDVVFGSDLVYDTVNLSLLFTTAKALLSDDDESACFLLSYVHRSDYLWVR